MELIDIGINLMHNRYHSDRDKVIANAIESNVKKMIITGTTLWNSKSALIRAKKHPNILYSTLGVHPHNARDFSDETIKEFRTLGKEKEVVAIGECGLDFDRDFSPREAQKICFEEHLKLACELELPVFLHERESFKDFIIILEKYKNKLKNSVVHCFTGNKEELEKYIELDLYIGITGAVLDERRSHLKEIIKLIPSNRLMIETDGPFLLPKSLKKLSSTRRNEPAFLVPIAKEIAFYLDKTYDELVNITTKNAKDFFNI
ncbi:MAG: TatD family hydrolase [Candidatus Sericytochromatia bacterium]